MKKQFCLILALALILSLLAGCAGSGETAETPAAESAAESSAPAEASQTPAPSQAPAEESPASEAPAASEAPVESAEPQYTVEYPIPGDNTLTLWAAFDVNAFGNYYSSFNDKPSVKYVQEKTGVLLEFVEVSSTVATEQFNLMIASGDYTDLLSCGRGGSAGGPGGGGTYVGGMAQAYEDEVIIDLTDYIQKDAPDFWAELETYGTDGMAGATVDGLFLNLATFTKSVMHDSGMWTRADWLEKLGLEMPTTFDEMIDVAYAYHDAYNTTHTITIGPGCNMNYADCRYGTALFQVSGSDIAMFREGDTLISGMTTDGYREYLEDLHQLYADGIINDEFYVSELGRNESMSLIGGGGLGFWQGMADHSDEFYTMAKDPDFEVAAMPIMVGDDGVYDFATATDPVGGGGPSVSVKCKDPELAVQFLNWFYTKEGYMFANYGKEGETYNIDENGSITYTDLMLNNPTGMNSQQCFMYYGWSHTGSVSYGDKNLDTYSDKIRDIITMWSDESLLSTEHDIPTAAALDVEETNSITSTMTDVTSYASEVILQWVIGTTALTDDTWAEYVAQCETLGLNRCVEVYQKAYDDYLAQKNAEG